jgi:hypothetical protein
VKQTQAIPKKRDAARAVKVKRRQGEGFYVLTMLDYSHLREPLALGLWPTWKGDDLPTKPVAISGLCPLPARFSVSGAEIEVEIELVLDRVKLDKSGKRSKLGWVSVIVKNSPQSVVNEMPRLPLETLAKSAIKLCGVVGLWYPPSYDGPMFADLDLVKPREGWRVQVPKDQKFGEAYFVAWSDSRDPIVKELATAHRPPKVNSDPPERLKLVAETWLATSKGAKIEAVRQALKDNTGYEWGYDNTKRLIKKCRAIGLIPQSTRSS